MDEREYLVKAQEADAVANASLSAETRRVWEGIAEEYRRLAHAVAEIRKSKTSERSSQN